MFVYHIDPGRRLIITRVSGRLNPLNLAEFLPRLVRDPKFDPTYDALVIAMDAEAVPPPATAVLLGPIVRGWSARRSGVRWAFVLPSEQARQAAEAAINQVRLTSVLTRCFISEGSATAWLETPNPARATRSPLPI